MDEPIAYTMINVELPKNRNTVDIVNDMLKHENVVGAYRVLSRYDIVAKIKAYNLDKVNETVKEAIKRNNGVHFTCTVICKKGFTRDPETGEIKEHNFV